MAGPQWSQEQIDKAFQKFQDGLLHWGEGDYNGYNQTDRNYAIVKAYKDIFGRAPSLDEFNAARPATDQGQLDVFVSQAHQATENTPDKIYKKQQEEYQAQAPKHYDSINQLFQNSLGRAATQDELNHFGSLLASGTTDQYQLGEFLKQQPEYTQKQDKEFQNNLSGQLAGYDQQYFSEQILPSIQQAYAKQGRSFDSSGFQNAATQSAQQQNTTRQQYLAQLSASQYGGRQQNAYNDYAQQVQNQQNLTNAGIQAQYAQIQNVGNRANQFADYGMQQQAYNQYLARYGNQKPGVMDWANLALNGVRAGAQVYGAAKGGSY